jgi:hypothetical protein
MMIEVKKQEDKCSPSWDKRRIFMQFFFYLAFLVVFFLAILAVQKSGSSGVG